jgi:replication factor C large subunit
MGQSKKARTVRDSAAKKIGGHLHLSARYVRLELMDFMGQLLGSKKVAPLVAAELDLNQDEIALLMGSTPTTKKVQSIFEQAQALREKEAEEDIEFGWRGKEEKPARLPEAPVVEADRQGFKEARDKSNIRLEVSEGQSPAREGGGKKQRSLFDF